MNTRSNYRHMSANATTLTTTLQRSTVAYGVSGLLLISSIAALALPSTPLQRAPQTVDASPASSPEENVSVNAERFNALFDLSRLQAFERAPPPEAIAATGRPAQPPENPLTKYAYFGGARGGAVTVALVGLGDKTMSLNMGQQLEGYTLVGFDHKSAVFAKGDHTVTLNIQ
ncbi:MAG: hypothetical protein AAGJ87_12375 [Pseudomonadota bacterium]